MEDIAKQRRKNWRSCREPHRQTCSSRSSRRSQSDRMRDVNGVGPLTRTSPAKHDLASCKPKDPYRRAGSCRYIVRNLSLRKEDYAAAVNFGYPIRRSNCPQVAGFALPASRPSDFDANRIRARVPVRLRAEYPKAASNRWCIKGRSIQSRTVRPRCRDASRLGRGNSWERNGAKVLGW